MYSPPGLNGDFIVEKIRNEVNADGMSSNTGVDMYSYLCPAKPLQSGIVQHTAPSLLLQCMISSVKSF